MLEGENVCCAARAGCTFLVPQPAGKGRGSMGWEKSQHRWVMESPSLQASKDSVCSALGDTVRM